MPRSADIAWFKKNFQAEIAAATTGTPISLDMLAALACQETGEIWPALRTAGLSTPRTLQLCVGDTLDENRGRKAFPKNKTELINAPHGQQMFNIARAALVEMAAVIPAYAAVAAKPNKFCHGFGMFQRDLQFFKSDPNYFLQKKYEVFNDTLNECLKELKRGLVKLHLQGKTQLTDMEAAAVAITYNTGRYVPSKGLKQGHYDGRRYYGENYFDYLRLAHTVPLDGEAPLIPSPMDGESILPLSAEPTATGALLRVHTQIGTLHLRSDHEISTPSRLNVIANLPDGHSVRAVSSRAIRGFREVETMLGGALLRGYCFAKFLVPDEPWQSSAPLNPNLAIRETKIIAATMPMVRNRIARRRDEANALSLNEPGQPVRTGTSADELREALASIIEWLAVDRADFKRYRARQGRSYCNIYAHDYCHLAGVYLPRVWWTSKALVDLSRGEPVKPLIGGTVDEVRANGLFRWLRDYGLDFGWRQTASLTELQQAANQGGVALIIARRKEDGKSGHVAMVVPETSDHRARRNFNGEVTNPLQSQAGSRNFRYGVATHSWWQGEQFAESASWIHP